MSNEFKPGHPVVFWVFIILLTFTFFSAAKAAVTADDCGDTSNPTVTRAWQVWPPEWVCGKGEGVKFL